MTATTDDLLDDQIIAACDRLMARYHHCVNLTGVDVGFAWKKGLQTRQIALRLHVHTKIPPQFLSPKARFPGQFEGFPVDVMESCCAGSSTFLRPDGQSWLDWFEKTAGRDAVSNQPIHEYLTPEQFKQMFSGLNVPAHNRLQTRPATSPGARLMSMQWPNSPDKALPCHPNPFPGMAPYQGRIRPNISPTPPPPIRNWTAERLLAKLGQVRSDAYIASEHRQAATAVALRQKVSLMEFIWPNLKMALFAESPRFRELLPETGLDSPGFPDDAGEWIASAVNFWPAFENIYLQVTPAALAQATDFLDVLTSLHRNLRKLGYEVV